MKRNSSNQFPFSLISRVNVCILITFITPQWSMILLYRMWHAYTGQYTNIKWNMSLYIPRFRLFLLKVLSTTKLTSNLTFQQYILRKLSANHLLSYCKLLLIYGASLIYCIAGLLSINYKYIQCLALSLIHA